MKKITTPLSDETIKNLHAGDQVLLSGDIYTGRDAAHKRLIELLAEGKPMPFDFRGQAVYYTGPCPAPPGRAIGSVGPTTSQRMDSYAPRLIQEGLRIMIGKGNRSKQVIEPIREFSGVYFAAIGGAGALMALCVDRAEIVAFNDLGPEAIYRLTVRDMPLTVAIDCTGSNIYER
ncbi:MAG: Fe-S-containing hydro-lyase [Treponema sp.]|nr:Fe-S-containing hydro-lyase [Treponema sp.]